MISTVFRMTAIPQIDVEMTESLCVLVLGAGTVCIWFDVEKLAVMMHSTVHCLSHIDMMV